MASSPCPMGQYHQHSVDVLDNNLSPLEFMKKQFPHKDFHMKVSVVCVCVRVCDAACDLVSLRPLLAFTSLFRLLIAFHTTC